eukprot:gene17786-27401_t
MRSLALLVAVGIAATCAEASCADWRKPANSDKYPKWPYCNRMPEGDYPYKFLDQYLPPANSTPYVCKSGVLRYDASGIICADYSLGDEYAGACDDAECCVEGVCDAYTCKSKDYTLRSNAASINCFFGCNDNTCCKPTKPVPKYPPQGLMFVDEDPGRFSFGGTLHLIRALDESDITHYRVYWGYSREVRKAPDCAVHNPVSWNTQKWYDDNALLAEVAVTGLDHDIVVPNNTKPVARCPITYDRKEHSTSASDPCNSHYWFAVSVNENGATDLLAHNVEMVGPKHPIKDYEGGFDLPCAESGVTMGRDLPAEDDVMLGKKNNVSTALECQQLCEAYTGSPPCQFWTWSWPAGGPTASSCWIESQMLQQTHYTVRIIGPRVCPTPARQAPTGRERTRCTRWKRYQNLAPFSTESDREKWMKQSRLSVQRPQLPDVPLGPYNYAEGCRAVCDMDPICVGYVFMKKDPSDTYFHKCWMIHDDAAPTLKGYGAYDTWMCSRGNMAPLLNGYELQQRDFGYRTCDEKELREFACPDADCCALRCDGEGGGCKAFTYWNEKKTCSLYGECAKFVDHDGVPGCALASCYDEHGAATYKKDAREDWSIVDRWPDTWLNDDRSLTIAIQTTPGLEGAQFACAAVRVGNPAPSPVPATLALLLADPVAGNHTASAAVATEHAVLSLRSEVWGTRFYAGQKYSVTCMLHDAASFPAAPASQTATVSTRQQLNFVFTGAGYCKSPPSDKCQEHPYAVKTVADFDACREECESRKECSAFWFRWSDNWCNVRKDNCSYTATTTGSDVDCWRRAGYNAASGPDYFGPGNDRCEKMGGVTCAYTTKFGSYDRNYFMPSRQSFNTSECPAATDAPEATPAPDTLPPSTQAPATDSPRTTLPATFAPDTVSPATPYPLTLPPATRSPATFVPATAHPDTLSPLTRVPTTEVPGTSIPVSSVPATGFPATAHPSTSAPGTLFPVTEPPVTPAPGAPGTVSPGTIPPGAGTLPPVTYATKPTPAPVSRPTEPPVSEEPRRHTAQPSDPPPDRSSAPAGSVSASDPEDGESAASWWVVALAAVGASLLCSGVGFAALVVKRRRDAITYFDMVSSSPMLFPQLDFTPLGYDADDVEVDSLNGSVFRI